MGLGLKLSVVMGIAMAVMAGLGYLYYRDSERTKAELSQRVGEYGQAIKTQEQSINMLQQQTAIANAQLSMMSDRINEIREETTKISKVFARHDLGFLASKKPNLVEKSVNAGTQRVFNTLETETDPRTYGGVQ
jgi:hypothetical protein